MSQINLFDESLGSVPLPSRVMNEKPKTRKTLDPELVHHLERLSQETQTSFFDTALEAVLETPDDADFRQYRLDSENYVHIADLLLEYAIAEAFGESTGGAPFEPSEEAWAWIVADPRQGRDWPFSFFNCCRTAGLDPEELREQLVALRARLVPAPD